MSDIPGLGEVVADTRVPRAERARRAAALIRATGDYRWVGVYDAQTALIAADGTTLPEYPRFRIPVYAPRTRTAAGTLVIEGEHESAFSDDVAFLEECAAALRPLFEPQK